jgi:poly [ADP-ribose] polymerase
MLKEKLNMVESLGDIEIATRILSNTKLENLDRNPLDSYYASLNSHVRPLESGSERWNLIEAYVNNTHAPTHMDYNLEIMDIYEVERFGESQNFTKYQGLHNQALLWHGSRLSNWVGILSQGLRIAPPEAPVTGYM